MELSCFAPARRNFTGLKSFRPHAVDSSRTARVSQVRCKNSKRPRTEEATESLRKEAEEILGWDSICEQVSRFASTSRARALCRSGGMRIGRDRGESEMLLEQTAAAVSLLPRSLDFSGIEDVAEYVRIAASGEVLGVRELCALERSLRAARKLYEQLLEFSSEEEREEESANRYRPLLEVFAQCNFMMDWVQDIGYCIDSNLLVVLDRASSKLKSIRTERRRNMGKLESSLKDISSRVYQAGGIDSPLVTKRRSRMCVGIRASHKSLLPDGIVLGISSSGATYFIEPRDAMEFNNKEVRLSNSEKAEEFAILSKFTSGIARFHMEILHLMEKIHELDIACARGAYAVWINGTRPIFSELHEEVNSNAGKKSLMVDIEGICHPLLLENTFRNLSISQSSEPDRVVQMHEGNGSVMNKDLTGNERVVPLDIKIKHMTKVVVISGPNTGGKTVTMKTLGLASLMSKAGLYLPAKNEPRLPWFDQVLADIGDHQSLEHNLSTFSGHISRLCKIFRVASRQSLVLIDEIGNGTDPSEGVALSISILQYIVDHVNLAVVTTHYTDLTLLKAHDSRFENAAMEFCIKTLRPTYHILWGTTGSSNALSIAKTIGFDQEVLNHAQDFVEKLMPDKQKERQGLLYQSLLEERNKLEARTRKVETVLSEVKKLYAEIQSEAEDLPKREAILKSKESQKVREEVNAVKGQIDIIVKKFEDQLKIVKPEQFNALFRRAEASIANLVEAHSSGYNLLMEKDGGIQYTPQIGDQVRVKGLGAKLVTVVEVMGDVNYAMVQYGKIRMRVKRKDMKLINSSIKSVSKASNVKGQEQWQDFKRSSKEEAIKVEDIPFGAAVQTSKNSLDLRGMRVEEASNCLKLAISSCRPGGVLFVIHGTGTGAVKQCVLGILSKNPRVVKFEDESPTNYGCTVVHVK